MGAGFSINTFKVFTVSVVLLLFLPAFVLTNSFLCFWDAGEAQDGGGALRDAGAEEEQCSTHGAKRNRQVALVGKGRVGTHPRGKLLAAGKHACGPRDALGHVLPPALAGCFAGTGILAAIHPLHAH